VSCLESRQLDLDILLTADRRAIRIFAVYPRCEDSVKAALRNISTPLLRSLGSKHTRLLESLRNFPLESEPFALHVLTVLTDSSRPSPGLVDVIKALAEERDLSAAFLIPIAAYMNRVSTTVGIASIDCNL
jgi:symplekin